MKQIVWVLLAIAALALFFGDGSQSEETFRYKLTINVTVDGSAYSASSVIEATQTRARSWWFGVSGSGASGGVYPEFTAKGVAPMITLPDGAVIFASLTGNHSDNPPGAKGASVSHMPWLIYVDTWWAGTDRSKYKNLPVVPLPKETPRVEVPFEGHPKSKFRPAMRIAIPRRTDYSPVRWDFIGPSNASERSGRAIDLISFVIEPARDPLITCIQPAPEWLVEARQEPRLQGTLRSLETCKG